MIGNVSLLDHNGAIAFSLVEEMQIPCCFINNFFNVGITQNNGNAFSFRHFDKYLEKY